MEDIIKALLDVVRAQHSATEGSEEKPFDINDIIDMALNITGRPEEPEEQQELSDTIQKMAESLAPDIFPPKTFEEMDDSERAASAVNMIEERLRNGGRRKEDAAQNQEQIKEQSEPDESNDLIQGKAQPVEENQNEVPESDDYGNGNMYDMYGEDEVNHQEAANLNDLIYNNFMQMMGLNDPKVEYPFDRSQIRYGREKTATEMLAEDEANKAEERALKEQRRRPVSAWELAQAAVDKDEEAHQKEEYEPKEMQMPETKSASQLAAEAIAKAKEEDQMKLEAEKRAERLMEEARKRGKDPMEFALHQQEILNYMEKNSDELVSFEDYEDLSPEEKLEIERQLYREKQLEAGVAPEDIQEELPDEIKEQVGIVPQQEEQTKEEQKGVSDSPEEGQEQQAVPAFSDNMLRMISQEVVNENADMILSEDENADLEAINHTIFENLKTMMSQSGGTVSQEDMESLIGEVISRNTAPDAEQAPDVEQIQNTEQPQAAEQLQDTEQLRTVEEQQEKETIKEPLSAVELARAAQQAARPEPQEIRETKSAVEIAKEAQKNAVQKKVEAEPENEDELSEEDLNFDDLDLEEEEQEEVQVIENIEKKPEPEKNDSMEETTEEAAAQKEEEEQEEKLQEQDAKIPEEERTDAKIEAEEPGEDEKEPEEEYEYVDPGELVLGEHTQAEIDEALDNLSSLGLEGEVYERAKRMLLLELAGSEVALDAWLEEQENGKKKKAAVSALDTEDTELDDLDDLDEDDLERELELAMDEDFVEEVESESEKEPEEEDEQDEPADIEPKEEILEEQPEAEEVEKSAEESQPAPKLEKEEADTIPKETENKQEADYIPEPEENIQIEKTKPEKKEKKASHNGKSIGKEHLHSRKHKNMIKRKEKAVQEKEEKEFTAVIPTGQPVEEKEFQVSVRNPFVLKNSASFMDKFEEYIVDTQENRKLSTGFKRLDAMLRYGLHKGSYFVDSMPQYLKNGFMQQIADRAAESGVDVLYISTELSRYDLMVDTISRLSYEMNKKDEEKAVSSMAIMTGEKGADIRSLKDELNWYRGRISEHLFVLDQEAVSEYVENMEDASAGDILEELIRSIVTEGAHKPVVFIDNIENILSAEDSEDMKPLMDGIRKLAKELGIPILMSYGYAQAESESELDAAEIEFHESLGNMCDVYLELKYADMITEDYEELTEEDIQEMVEDGEMLLINVLLHKNRRTMKASCQIQATPKFNYYEE